MESISNSPRKYGDITKELAKENNTVGEVLEKMKKKLNTKYGIKKDTVLNLTSEEFSTLKNEIKDKKTNEQMESYLTHTIYEEYIETKIEGDNGVSEVNLDLVTKNIENTRINQTKDILSQYVEKFTDKYDFLGQNEKEIFKLAIANKILKSFSPIEMLDISKNIEQIGEGIKKFNYDTIKNSIGNLSSGFKGIKNKLDSNFDPYEKLFNKVESDLNKGKYKKQTKIKIISNIEWFHSPKEIENYTGEDLIFDYKLLKDKGLKTKLDNVNEVKEYLISSRMKIEQLSEKLKMGTKMKKMALEGITNPDFGKYIETGLTWLLKIPFIGQMIAMFLGLNPDKPIESLQKEKETYKTYKKIQNFGGKVDSKGITTENTDSKIKILADKDLSELDYEKLKPSLEEINILSNNAKTVTTKDKNGKEVKTKENILEQFFSVNGYNGIKIDITDDCFTDKKPNDKFYKKIKKGIEKHKKLKEDKKNQLKITKYKAKQKVLNKENNTKIIDIQHNLNTSNNILKNNFLNYENLPIAIGASVKGVFNDNNKELFANALNNFQKIDDIYQYKSILIKELPEKDQDIKKFLINKLGENDWNDELKEDQTSLILFIKQVQKYSKKGDFVTLGDALKKKENILKDYRNNLIKDKKEILSKNKLATNLKNITGNLIEGIKEKDLKMKLDSNILTFDNEKYSFKLPEGVEIEKLTLDSTNANIKINLLTKPIKIERSLINVLILEAKNNNKSEFTKNGITIKLNKITS